MHKHRVVVIGGGFAGLAVARGLRRASVDVTLVDRRNFHLFQPLLYQVATGGLSPADIATPLRTVFRRQRNVAVLLGEAIDIDAEGRRVILADGDLTYDTLVVATGSSHHYFGHGEWARHAPGLKTVEDAIEIRRRLLSAFERAERTADPGEREALLRFVVVGAGPTGVELAGALAEIARDTLAREFRRIDPASASILLVEASDRVLPGWPARLSADALRSLTRLGVTARLGTAVTGVDADGVSLRTAGGGERIAARSVVWAAGVRGSPLAAVLARRAGARLDAQGRVAVGGDLALPAHPEIVVVGDLALCFDASGRPLPGVAPTAMQQGAYAAGLIDARLRGRPVLPFRYRDWGTLATIGRHAAVADLLGVRFSGYLAWLVWLFVHLMRIVEFENRILVFVQWAWSYLTYRRVARLITGSPWWREQPAGTAAPPFTQASAPRARNASGRSGPDGAQSPDADGGDHDADGHAEDLLPSHAGRAADPERVGRRGDQEQQDSGHEQKAGCESRSHQVPPR